MSTNVWCTDQFIAELPVSMQARTNGKGNWSTNQRTVHIYKLTTVCYDYEVDYRSKCNCSLRAYFTTRSWDVYEHGLIYTDPGWLKDFREGLVELGVSPHAAGEVDYTEQGAQDFNYVDLSAPTALVRTLFPDEVGTQSNPKKRAQLKNRLLR